jgi:hypothetical protein
MKSTTVKKEVQNATVKSVTVTNVVEDGMRNALQMP